MKGCGTFKVNEVMGAIDGLRKAACAFMLERLPPRPEEDSPKLRALGKSLERLDKLLGPLP